MRGELQGASGRLGANRRAAIANGLCPATCTSPCTAVFAGLCGRMPRLPHSAKERDARRGTCPHTRPTSGTPSRTSSIQSPRRQAASHLRPARWRSASPSYLACVFSFPSHRFAARHQPAHSASPCGRILWHTSRATSPPRAAAADPKMASRRRLAVCAALLLSLAAAGRQQMRAGSSAQTHRGGSSFNSPPRSPHADAFPLVTKMIDRLPNGGVSQAVMDAVVTDGGRLLSGCSRCAAALAASHRSRPPTALMVLWRRHLPGQGRHRRRLPGPGQRHRCGGCRLVLTLPCWWCLVRALQRTSCRQVQAGTCPPLNALLQAAASRARAWALAAPSPRAAPALARG